MIGKNLSRRLERLKDSMLPTNEEPMVLVIVGVDADGKATGEICRLTVPAFRRPPKPRRR